MGALGPPRGNPGTPYGIPGWASGTHWAMHPGLWEPMGQGAHWPRTRASGDPGALGTRGLRGPGPLGTQDPYKFLIKNNKKQKLQKAIKNN